MNKKESYKHILPHFQQPGQAYFVTWCLQDAVPKKALKRYSEKLEIIKSQITLLEKIKDNFLKTNHLDNTDRIRITHKEQLNELEKLKTEYYSVRKKYIKTYNNFLDKNIETKVNLLKQKNLNILKESLNFWAGNKLENFAFCIMPNHIHWVFQLFEKDQYGKPVYLQDIMHSVKRFSSNRINKAENRNGPLWQKESFDTTIRNEEHLYYCIEYTLNNPVVAGFVSEREEWPGCGCF